MYIRSLIFTIVIQGCGLRLRRVYLLVLAIPLWNILAADASSRTNLLFHLLFYNFSSPSLLRYEVGE